MSFVHYTSLRITTALTFWPVAARQLKLQLNLLICYVINIQTISICKAFVPMPLQTVKFPLQEISPLYGTLELAV